MKVTQEKLPDSQVGLEIEVPADISKQTYEQTLRKYMKTANIPGFRKGKVPRQILVQQLGANRLKAAALEELVQTAIDKAISQEKIEALGNYQLRSGFESLIEQFEPGKVLTISASVDVPPQAELDKYQGLSVKAEEIAYSADRITETLESYQQNLASLVPVEDRTAQEGDVAVVDFVGKIVEDGKEPEEFEGGSASEFQVEIKEGRFIPGFVEGIVGMELGQTKDVEVSFPDEYPQADLAGKPAVFSITLNDLKERELPDLDDDLAQEVSEFETLAELKQSLEERFKKEAEDATKANTETALLDELVTHLQVEIPRTLLQREVDHIVTQTVMQLSNQGIDINKFLTKELVENMRENAKPEATERLRRTLALGEVAKQESISVDEDAVTTRMKEMMSEVDDPTKIDQDRLKQVVNEDLLKEKILTWLSENASVELVPEGTLAPNEEADTETAATLEEE
ncbi:trigger factor [Leptolyngbyaceae cyanobacterium CCMR0082]|uniref:Trigger factor n=1 Tax=Adonisia turfae CCMR0082 TaxID=2304604 RepID=A0A6M0S350_9CYAN|nr:trigger factor [Adonisia turfae]MDV3349421.1 trigger factor [Leptothoe sp. LEGE 181152]NEZ62835.1 trigger factor [Adonisia turfae CCMR0082]